MLRHAVLIACVLLGCQQRSCAASTSRTMAYRDVCPCNDMACASEIQEQWAIRMGAAASAADQTEPSDDDKRMMQQLSLCMTKFAGVRADDRTTVDVSGLTARLRAFARAIASVPTAIDPDD